MTIFARHSEIRVGTDGIILSSVMPYKEDVEEEMYGTGPRKRKEAEAIKEDDGWFW